MENKAESIRDEYRKRFAGLEQYRNDVWKILCDKFFSRHISPESHVLDLGAGWGEFINNIKAAKKYALDINPDTESRLSAGIKFLRQDCSKEWQIDSESLDVVFTSNFLEHLPDKNCIERTIEQAYRCLKDNGLIICLGPNIKYVHGAYWDFWDHSIPLTESSVSELLGMKGFDIQLCKPRFLTYSMSNGKIPSLFTVGLYLKLPILWNFFGKQFLVIGRNKKKLNYI